MTAPFTNADSLREYLTGAGSVGAHQPSQSASIGGYRSSVDAHSSSVKIDYPIPGVKIELACCDTDQIGFLETVGNSGIRWTHYGDATGSNVSEFTPGDIRILESTNKNNFLRVKGNPPFPEGAVSYIFLKRMMNNVFGFSNVPDADATSGKNYYRATILKNVSASTIYNLKRCIMELGTWVFSDQTQLGASGAGTIKTGGNFTDWPATGWCRIVKADGSLREIVYYSSRTSDTLTVPSAGRHRLGSSAAAGAVTDSIHAVPGIAIALDTTGIQTDGATILTIANENTAPAGVTWNTGISPSAGLTVGPLYPGKAIGIWMWREIPAGAIYSARSTNLLNTTFTVDNEDYSTERSGDYRIQNLSAAAYLVYVGVNTHPDFDAAPYYTTTTLPLAVSYPRPGSGLSELHIAMRQRNSYGLISKNQYCTIVTLSHTGIVDNVLLAPTNVGVFSRPAGAVRVLASYLPFLTDDPKADKLRVWIGVTPPNPAIDTPTYVADVTDSTVAAEFGAYSPGTYYVATALYRTADSSQSAAVTGTVEIPALPDEPIAVPTENAIL